MVTGKERTNWYSDHPPACTCVGCESRRVADARFQTFSTDRKIGRNELCPCASGKKFKKCHGS
ncbi:MAG: hypothetical protein CL743_04535 [Chloroflexi bacterium]|nr:hypothetical protein [Chloroflexota bacterium]MBN86570.1 hypothetical protein [Dehalococcoidia bacterium]